MSEYNPSDPNIVPGVTFNESNKLSSALYGARLTGDSIIMGLEFSPFNEGLRFGFAAAAQVAGYHPVVVAAVIGGTTLTFEGLSSVAGADLLDSKFAKKTVEKVRDFGVKRGIPEDYESGLAVDSAIAFLGGAAVLTVAKQIQQPERTKKENMIYGLKVSGALSGVLAVQSFFISNSIEHPNPLPIAGAALAAGSVVGLFKAAKNKLTVKKLRDKVTIEGKGN